MTVQAVEAAVAVKQQHEQKKTERKQEKASGNDPAPARSSATPSKSSSGSGSKDSGSGPKDSGSGPKGGGSKGSGSKGGGLKPGPMSAREQRAVNWAWSGNRKVLTAQWILCTVILILGALTSDDKAKSSASRAMVKGSALALLFFLLALLSSAGGSSAKAATAMGTLVTAAYALTSSDVHAVVKWVGAFFKDSAKNAGKASKDDDTGSMFDVVQGAANLVDETERQAAQGSEFLTDTGSG